MALTKEEKADLIAAITAKIEGNENLIILISSIDDAQMESDKTKFINVIHSYCAFCGEKLDKEKEVEKEPSMDHLDEQHHFLDNPNE